MLTGSVYIYRGGMSEPDSVVMAAGMARMAAGESLSACMLYGRFLNPGIYILFKLIHPLFVRSPGDTIPFLNILGVLSFSILTGLFYLLLRRRFDRTVAVCGTLIAMLTPVFWETGTYFHPIVPALALLAGSILLFDRISSSPGGIIALLAVTALAAAAMVMRNEVLLAVPALFAAAALSKRPAQNLIFVVFITVLSCLAFLFVARAVSLDGKEGLTGFSGGFSSWLAGSASLKGLLRTVPWAVMVMGTASVLLASWGTLSQLMNRKNGEIGQRSAVTLIPALLWAIPVILIWLFWPVPVLRHYFVAVPAIVYLLAATVLSGRGKRAVIIITAAVITLNLGLPELLYRTYNSVRPDGAKEPHGTFFYRHSLVKERIERYHILLDEIAICSEAGQEKEPQCVILPVNWEIYGYAIYRLADRSTSSVFKRNPATGIDTHQFATEGSSIRLIFSSRFDFDKIDEETLLEIERSAGPGCIVLLPGEIRKEVAARLPASVRITIY